MARKQIKKKVDITQDNIIRLSSLMFKDDNGNPLKWYPTQEKIFRAIVLRQNKYIGIIAPTQYGKSLAVALAALTLAAFCPLRIKIIAPTKEKTRIIMDYVIRHIFDDPHILAQLQYSGKLEQLRQERNKDKVTFSSRGEIEILTADARNKRRVGESVLGEGGDVIILDESSLIDDDLYAMIFRMVGATKESILIELGNPIKRGHFYNSMTADKDYLKIWIDYKVALAEGKFSQEFIDKARTRKFFDVLYECRFPDEMTADEKGYTDLLSYEAIEKAMNDNRLPADDVLKDQLKSIRWKVNSSGKIQIEPKDDLRLRGFDSPDRAEALSLTFYRDYPLTAKVMGCDVAGGSCENVQWLRTGETARLISVDTIADTMATVGRIKLNIEQNGVKPGDCNVDKDGLGKPIVDRLHEMGMEVTGVNNASSPDEVNTSYNAVGKKITATDYANKKAEMYWRLKEWVEGTYRVKDDSPRVRFL